MSKKNERVARLITSCEGKGLDAHYLAFFECFNQGLFFEAHEVLEHLWLAGRGGANHAFYKGLIQLAGAFVHLQRNRPGPAAALFRLAEGNLRKYPESYEHLEMSKPLGLIALWLAQLERRQPLENLWPSKSPPELRLSWPV